MHILLKCPTRGRSLQFLSCLRGWISRALRPQDISVLVSYDDDDTTMTDEVIEEAKRIHPALVAVKGSARTKIEACNADLAEYPLPWDVVLLVSDDMRCIQMGWDALVEHQMFCHYPDNDGALWFYDGRHRDYNVFECVGRKRYERFGYLYHPSYVSFACDLESTAVGLLDGKLSFIEHQLFEHDQPFWTKKQLDETYTKNLLWGPQDERNYHSRKAAGFP